MASVMGGERDCCCGLGDECDCWANEVVEEGGGGGLLVSMASTSWLAIAGDDVG